MRPPVTPFWTKNNLAIYDLSGAAARVYFAELAALRFLFREYPYLYDGDLENERNYLNDYFACPTARILAAFADDELIGFCSLIPLADAEVALQSPFRALGQSVADYLYVGEVLIYPAWRRGGIFSAWLAYAEKIARAAGEKFLTAMTVERPVTHPLKPQNYVDIEVLMHREGWRKTPERQVKFSWRQVDSHGARVENVLVTWEKAVNG